MIQALRNFLTRRTFAYKIRNKAMNMFSSFENFQRIRKQAEENRVAEGRNHEVLYFHKVDDPYSHLTVHYIDKFKEAYDVEFKPILVGEENPAALHEPLYIPITVWKMQKELRLFTMLIFQEIVTPRNI